MSPAETIKIKVYKQIFNTATAELTNNVNCIKMNTRLLIEQLSSTYGGQQAN